MRELIAQYEEAVRNVADVQMADVMLMGFFEYLPMPAWIKAVQPDGTLRMVRVNRAYERELGVSAIDYATKPDTAVYSAQTAALFAESDMQAIALGNMVYLKEQDVDAKGIVREWCVWKWPITFDDVVIAVCGISVGGNGHERDGGST